LDAAQCRELDRWARAVEAWPAGSHRWGHYAEATASGDRICRTENVSACHPGFRALVEGPLAELAAADMGDAVTDFKDKLNYKQPGGAGFGVHQDLLAYPGAGRVVSLLVAVDECSVDSGCLWMAAGVDALLDTDERGVVTAAVAATLDWSAAELAPGDALRIDGLAPHYSESNRSDRSRRVFIASYAPAAEHYGRDDYYGARRRSMAEEGDAGRSLRISTLADFEGVAAAEAPAPATGRCTHG
jgi:hypothetical protein